MKETMPAVAMSYFYTYLGCTRFTDIEEARSETFNYIEGYYNRVRRHSALGYESPEEYERKYYAKLEEALTINQKKG